MFSFLVSSIVCIGLSSLAIFSCESIFLLYCRFNVSILFMINNCSALKADVELLLTRFSFDLEVLSGLLTGASSTVVAGCLIVGDVGGLKTLIIISNSVSLFADVEPDEENSTIVSSSISLNSADFMGIVSSETDEEIDESLSMVKSKTTPS